MKSGWQSGAAGTSDPLLRWNAGGSTQWNTTWEAGVWHNVAYGIDFDAGSVAFYHSTGAEDLVLAHEAVAVTASSDGKDWHVGVLELPRDGFADENEDVFFSGMYIESGELTTSVSGPGGVAAAPAASSVPVTSSSAPEVILSTATVIPVAASTLAPAISTPISSTIEAISTPAEPSTMPETLPTIPITFTLPSFSSTPTTLATLTRSSSVPSIPESTSTTETPALPVETPALTPEEEEDDDEDEDCEYEY
jgi:hypothetical protein